MKEGNESELKRDSVQSVTYRYLGAFNDLILSQNLKFYSN